MATVSGGAGADDRRDSAAVLDVHLTTSEKASICALMERGLWDFDDDPEGYDAARTTYEDFCLDGYPLHAIECPECGGKKTYLDEWYYNDDDYGWHEESCSRCKGRGVIRVEDETEEEGRRRAERMRPKPKTTTTFLIRNAGFLDGAYRVLVEHNEWSRDGMEFWNHGMPVFSGGSYEEARGKAQEWVDERTQAALSSAAAGTQPTCD